MRADSSICRADPVATPTNSELRSRLEILDTCVISDAMDALSVAGAELRVSPMGPAQRIVGPCVTVRLISAEGQGTPLKHLCATAIEMAQAGDVILIEHQAPTVASGWGGLLSVAARRKAVAGVVINGLCRDVDDFWTLDFGVWAAGSAPRSARGRVVEESTGGTLTFGGVDVRPGDWVVADRTGALTIPAADIENVLVKAESLARREQLMAADLRAGSPVSEVLGTAYETMLTTATRETT
jgi:4-hydroxy-4-methyl-2-oxoglutarate aldolase